MGILCCSGKARSSRCLFNLDPHRAFGSDTFVKASSEESRLKILQRVDDALRPLGENRSPYPEWSSGLIHSKALRESGDRIELFKKQWVKNSGVLLEGRDALVQWLEKEEAGAKIYASPSVFADGSRPSSWIESWDDNGVREIPVGITPAWGGIAETGTVILNDGGGYRRLAALAPWVHVAVVSRERILASVEDAVLELGQDPSVIWVTGPSKTADVEGILIEGVHGPGVQVCCLID